MVLRKVTTMNKEKLIEYIKLNLDDRTLWEQLAEEGSELTQAALKFIRASGYSNNPTPINDTVAYYNVIEELRDVLCVCELLGLKNIEPNNEKLERWVKRIKGEADTPKGEVVGKKVEVYRNREDGCTEAFVCSNCGAELPEYGCKYCPDCGRYISEKI